MSDKIYQSISLNIDGESIGKSGFGKDFITEFLINDDIDKRWKNSLLNTDYIKDKFDINEWVEGYISEPEKMKKAKEYIDKNSKYSLYLEFDNIKNLKKYLNKLI